MTPNNESSSELLELHKLTEKHVWEEEIKLLKKLSKLLEVKYERYNNRTEKHYYEYLMKPGSLKPYDLRVISVIISKEEFKEYYENLSVDFYINYISHVRTLQRVDQENMFTYNFIKEVTGRTFECNTHLFDKLDILMDMVIHFFYITRPLEAISFLHFLDNLDLHDYEILLEELSDLQYSKIEEYLKTFNSHTFLADEIIELFIDYLPLSDERILLSLQHVSSVEKYIVRKCIKLNN